MKDEETGMAIGVFPEAFELRPDERDLSVNWMDFFQGAQREQLRQIIAHAELKLRPTHGYGVIEVGAFIDTCAKHGAKVRIIHEQTDKDPSHSAAHQYPRDNRFLFAELANLAGRHLTLVGEINA
jgi:hypothetical protein